MIWVKLESSNIILILGSIHGIVKRCVDIHHLIGIREQTELMMKQ